jgi:hypothetical protein
VDLLVPPPLDVPPLLLDELPELRGFTCGVGLLPEDPLEPLGCTRGGGVLPDVLPELGFT